MVLIRPDNENCDEKAYVVEEFALLVDFELLLGSYGVEEVEVVVHG